MKALRLLFLYNKSGGLHGSMPSDWGEIEWLDYLVPVLSCFVETLPSDWANMKSLLELNLPFNTILTRSQPSEWGNMGGYISFC